MDEGTSEESRLQKVVKRVLEHQLPTILARWSPSTRESETQLSLATGSKLPNSHTVSPLRGGCTRTDGIHGPVRVRRTAYDADSGGKLQRRVFRTGRQ